MVGFPPVWVSWRFRKGWKMYREDRNAGARIGEPAKWDGLEKDAIGVHVWKEEMNDVGDQHAVQ